MFEKRSSGMTHFIERRRIIDMQARSNTQMTPKNDKRLQLKRFIFE